jgi:hypothetical protein
MPPLLFRANHEANLIILEVGFEIREVCLIVLYFAPSLRHAKQHKGNCVIILGNVTDGDDSTVLKTQISREELDRLAEQIKSHFELISLERGLEYQQKGYVYNTEVLPNRTLISKVQGTRVYDVKIDLEFVAASECTCPYDGFCKHMAAAFFYVYSVYARPDSFVRQVRQELRQEREPLRQASSLHRKTVLLGGNAAPPDSTAILKESEPAAGWLAFMEAQFESFADKNGRHRHYLDEYYQAALQTVTQPTLWWSRTARQVYALLAGVFVMGRLEDDYRSRESGFAFYVTGYPETAKLLLDKWTAVIKEIDGPEARRLLPEHLDVLAERLRGALLDRPAGSPVDWAAAYRQLWAKLLNDPERMNRETELLQSALERREEPGAGRDTVMAAIVNFDLLRGQDDAAWDRWKQIRPFQTELLLPHLSDWSAQGEWSRVWSWLQRLAPAMKAANEKTFQALCRLGHEAANRLDCGEAWIGQLQALLPKSYSMYTEYLIQTGRYRQWVNFHLAERISFSELYPVDLRKIEAHDPALVFPLYHQTIDRCIVQKNRTAYKEAIRLLKKLGGLYGQLGQTDRFDRYVERLARRYSRLRAFQEELKKGKLIR